MASQNAPPYDLFISYTNEDASWVEGYLLDALAQTNVKYITEEAFRLGVPRLSEFERAIKESARTLLILSPSYLSENLRHFTDLLAQSYGLESATWPVIPLILKPVELPTRLTMLTPLEATDPEKWADVLGRLTALFGHPLPAEPEVPACPYPGMVPFAEADHGRFFGREGEVQEMLERLRLHPFLTVIGPSGSGKSSLVYAGLLPALRKSRLFGQGSWQIITMRPGETPLTTLKKLLPDARGTADKTLLFIDQFEEVFSLGGEETAPFLKKVQEMLRRPNLYLILTVRADFYSDLMSTPIWPQIQPHRLEVTPLGSEGLRQAIMRPAEAAGVFLEAALLERLLTDAAGEPGMLPLIQETLVLLWARIERRFLPLRAYTALILSRREYGEAPHTGLQVAIARRGDATLANLSPEERPIARRIFLRLVQFGEGREDTRRQQAVIALQAVADPQGRFERVLGTLAENRLITLTSEASGAAGDRKADLAHEALIRGWPTLQRWLTDRREAEQTRRRLETKADEWLRLGKGEGGLLDEFELLEAENWVSSEEARELGYREMLAELIEKSRENQAAAQDQALAQARKLAKTQRQRVQVLALGFAVALLLSLVAFSLFNQANRNLATAQEQERTARTGELAALALNQREDNLPLALLLGIEAFNTLDNPQTRHAFFETSRYNPALSQFLTGPTQDVRSVAWSPDGQLASGTAEGAILLWDLASGQPARLLEGHTKEVLGLAYSPDGRLASASADKTVIIWDLQLGKPALILRGHTNWALNVAWAPDNQVASGSCHALGENGDSCLEGEIIVWDLARSAPAYMLLGHSDDVRSLAWSVTGQLASGSDDGTVNIWDLETGQVRQRLEGHQNWVWGLAWAPDGGLASGACVSYSNDDFSCTGGKIILWDLEAGKPKQTLLGHTSTVLSLAWSAKNALVSGASDGSLILWDVAADEPAQFLAGHTARIWSVAWSSQGALASGSGDGTVIIWNIEPEAQAKNLSGHSLKVSSVAWSSEGLLASGSDDGTVRIWQPERKEPLLILEGHETKVLSLAWSREGTLASGSCAEESRDGFTCTRGEIILWDLENASPKQRLFGHQNWVRSLAWSPAGILASGSCAAFQEENMLCLLGELIVWDLERSEPAQRLTGHQSWIWSVAWSPTGMLTTGSCGKLEGGACVQGEIMLWDLATGQPALRLSGHQNRIRSVAWSTGGQLASGSDDGSLILWDEPGSDPVQTLAGLSSRVWSVAWTGEGRLATGLDDGRVIIWGTDSSGSMQLVELQTLEGESGAVLSVAWSESDLLASGLESGTINVWDMDPDGWRMWACHRAGRNLTQDEWQQYLSWREAFEPTYRTCPQWAAPE